MYHISIVSPNILFGTLSVYSNGSGETDDNTSASAVGAGFATSRLVHYKNNFVILQKKKLLCDFNKMYCKTDINILEEI